MEHKIMLEMMAEEFQQFKEQKNHLDSLKKPFWPIVQSEEEKQKILKQLAEMRASKEAELKAAEEERKAAEAAARASKDKKAPPPKAKSTLEEKQENNGEDIEEIMRSMESMISQPAFKSYDDDPSRVREFNEFKKYMLEIKTANTSVGSILGAMVYQIGQQKEKRHKDSLQVKPKTPA